MTAINPLVLILDLGGTNYRICLVQQDGTIVRKSQYLSLMDRGRDQVLKEVIDRLESTMHQAKGTTIIGLGVSVPGPVDICGLTLLSLPGRPEWNKTHMNRLLSKTFDFPIFIGNDANLGVLGEHRYGAGQGIKNMVYVTVSTGIGGGVLINGSVFHGTTGLSGEIGHMTVAPDGPRCRCGNFGCLQALSSGPAIASAAVLRILNDEKSIISQLVDGQLDQISSETVADAARKGDQMAIEVLDKAGRHLGQALVNIAHLLNPQRIILGGGVLKAGSFIMGAVMKEIDQRTMIELNGSFEVVLAGLGDNAPILGALTLVTDGVQ
ncbi:ROK family protein [SAR202 cluster bacterium AD-804-J14_MRT_500m]|nr:ROK family protein [SAR202 cluster bacterium AD-804-J14_MRT_500m]